MIMKVDADTKTKFAFYLGVAMGTLETILNNEEELKKFSSHGVSANELKNLRSNIIRVSEAFYDDGN